jgi:hypothetical protein
MECQIDSGGHGTCVLSAAATYASRRITDYVNCSTAPDIPAAPSGTDCKCGTEENGNCMEPCCPDKYSDDSFVYHCRCQNQVELDGSADFNIPCADGAYIKDGWDNTYKIYGSDGEYGTDMTQQDYYGWCGHGLDKKHLWCGNQEDTEHFLPWSPTTGSLLDDHCHDTRLARTRFQKNCDAAVKANKAGTPPCNKSVMYGVPTAN